MPATPPPPLLYSYRRCPYAMRARMALLQAGRAFDTLEIELRNKPTGLLAASPKGTVPVLVLEDGRVLDESWLIMAWAWQANDADGWWQRAQTPQNLALLQRNDGPFKQWLDRAKYPERHIGLPADRSATATTRAQAQRQALDQALALHLLPLQATLAHQPQLGGATPCATDLALFPFVRQLAAIDPAWWAAQAASSLPAVQTWLTGWLGSALFAACMAKPASAAA
ncbi:glutathione S-transferase N-terminal domain-containing protein [Ideonella sp.]|uniref:glutathione S-transferase N-terminal domain-containing protein n=1 Tax=Ideonella sp. TaxID=1929293 RepID=UPI003BB5291B